MTNRALEGNVNEKKFVKELNQNKKHKHWEKLKLKNNSDYYCVHITTQKYWKLTGKMEKPKADIFFAKCKLTKQVLIENDYYLNEQNYKQLKMEFLPNSGISIKMDDSKHYQIHKCGPDTFKIIFGSYELGAAASFYNTKIKDMNKNHKVLKIWKTDWKKMQNFFKDYKNIFDKIIEGENLEKYFDFFNEFAKESRIKIENIAKSSDKITNILFFGKKLF